MPSYRIAIVGPRDTIRGFSLLGADTVSAENPADAIKELYRLKKEITEDGSGTSHQTYAIIFITGEFLEQISPEDERKLTRGALPAIIPLPSHHGGNEYGMKRLSRIVERAIGSDILA